ncbi:ABC transporter [Azospira sp. I13]|uniref:ABC transporter permease n=1 Tax=Azospira sp. I13 TaxID=1765050 RepID=UPI000D44145C|nr:ABC transporter permease [Azospira sp. I13]GBG03961.1 ABC transporter [Azospira sp. I13]
MLPVALNLAYRQLTHRWAKLTGTLLGVCVAIILMFTQVGFRNALYDSAVAIPQALDADLFIAGPTFHSWADSPPWFARSLLFEAEGVSGTKRVTPLYSTAIQIASPDDGHSLSSFLLAFPAHAPTFLQADINRHVQAITLPNRAIMDRLSRDDFSLISHQVERKGAARIIYLNAGDALRKELEITQLFELGPSFTIDGTIITTELNFYRLTGIPLDRVGLGLVKVAEGYDPTVVKQAIQRKLGTRAKVFGKGEFMANERNYYATETPVGYIFQLGIVVGVLVGIVFISQALHNIVQDNIKEYATLRAMGYQQKFFVMLVASISLVISIVSYFPSVLVSWGVYTLAASATHLPLRMKAGDMASIFFIVVVMGLVATLLAIRKLKNADPVDLFS